jgi:acetyl esterase/lipase
MISIHGGAWYLNDRQHRNAIKRQLASHGVVVVAIDFRMPPEAAYPAALADINFAIRWVKVNAAGLGISAGSVGLQGESSGGHLAVLAAMRPHDPRYAAIPGQADWGAIDATVDWVIAFWPVISPLGRYRYAQLLRGQGQMKRLTNLVIPGHEQFWVTDHAMSEGDPVLALERDEHLELPPTLCIQGWDDLSHPMTHLERFVALYRRAGGAIELERPDLPAGSNLGLMMEKDSAGAVAHRVITRIVEFISKDTAG